MKVTQLCSTLCDLMERSPSGSSVHGILQARILEWVAIPFTTPGLNPDLWHYRQILYHLGHQGRPCICMCVHVCVYVCMYIYIYIYINLYKFYCSGEP